MSRFTGLTGGKSLNLNIKYNYSKKQHNVELKKFSAAQIIVSNKQRNKSSTEIIPKAISPPSSPKAVKQQTEHLVNHRHLAKSLSSPRSVNNTADNTTGLNSAPNTNVKKVANVTKKIKEKERGHPCK